jgi:D-arabinose 1-dehydrogenase-like Zn-dependent alcohol dehydrogenase
MPSNLDFLQGSTLVCAGLTAWNGLYGLESRSLKPGDWVLTQGTGGVSMFAVQFAKAAGAKVIATTSSAAKGEKLKALGADHVINYKEVENWGEEAKKLTPGGRGVQHILEVGGPNTMVRIVLSILASPQETSANKIPPQTQSLKAISFDGVISIVGFLGGVKGEQQPTFLDCLVRHSTSPLLSITSPY